MRNSFLKFHDQAQRKIAIVVVSSGILFFLVVLSLQFYEKNNLLLQQARYIEKSIRNDMLNGNKAYVYELCRSIFSDNSIVNLKVTKGNDVFCELEKEKSPYFYLSISVPVLFTPGDDLTDENVLGFVQLKIDSTIILVNFLASLICISSIILIFYFMSRNLHVFVSKNVIQPLSQFSNIMVSNNRNVAAIQDLENNIRFSELFKLTSSYVELTAQLNSAEKLLAKDFKNRALVDISTQVAHDIRSPLSSLNIILGTMKSEISKEKLVLIQGALNRINSISGDLLDRAKDPDVQFSDKLSVASDVAGTSIEQVVKQIISEKYLQKLLNENIILNLDLEEDHRLGSILHNDLARIISNTLDNSIEALNIDDAEIRIAVRYFESNAVISVTDNGVGVPEDILKRLGSEKISFGKENSTKSGSGLGVFHAKNTLEKYGGSLNIYSKVGVGTSVEIKLPLI